MKDNWSMKPLGELVTIQKGKISEQSTYNLEGFAPIINTDVLRGDIKVWGRVKGSVNCVEDDVLILWDGERSGLCAIGYKGVVGSTFAKMNVSNELVPEYLFRVVDFNFDWIQGQRTGTGVPHVPKDLKTIFKVNYPPLPQQQKIAKILSTVDNVIEKTESAIAKYQAIKQGLMHDLFTRGIDVNTGKLRPTPQEAPELYKESALGLIPRGWEVKKLEELLYLKSGEGITSKNISDFGQYPVYGGNGLRGYTNSYTHEGDYVLIGRQGALCGNITFSYGKMFASEHAVVVTINDDSNVKWIEYKLRLMNLNQYSEASAQPGLSVNKINRLLIKVPNAIEQNLIASRFIGLENKIQTEQQALAKYQQLKAGLLQDLLTGKVEVNVD